MAKKKTSTKRKGLFDTFEKVKSVRQGESLRFRDKKGKLVRFDARKNLIAEIWLGNKRTNRVLNKTKKGQPIPQKFSAQKTKRQVLFLQSAKKGLRQQTEIKQKTIKINAHQTITDNLEAKISELAEDVVKFSRRGNGGYIVATIYLSKKTITSEGKELITSINETITPVIKTSRRQYVFDELARYIIHNLYKNERRASNKDMTPNSEWEYVRSFKVDFSWQETKRLEDL